VCVILRVCSLIVCVLVLCLVTIFCMSCAVRSPSSKQACLCLGWRSLGAHAPVPPILQTTVDPSLFVCFCVRRPPCLCQRSPCVEICVCVFLLWPIWGKPFVTALGRCHFGAQSWLLLSSRVSLSADTGRLMWSQDGTEDELRKISPKWKQGEDRGYYLSSGLFICYSLFVLVP